VKESWTGKERGGGTLKKPVELEMERLEGGPGEGGHVAGLSFLGKPLKNQLRGDRTEKKHHSAGQEFEHEER